MQDSEDDKHIAERLRVPAKPTNDRSTATALVRRLYDEIHAAWMKDRQSGKTWAEIGRDLRPQDPIAGGTVGRAFARVTAERARSSKTARKAPVDVDPSTGSATQRAAADISKDHDKRRSPFARSSDPIRADEFGEDRHA